MHNRVLRFLTKKLWNEPAAIKGPVWTAAFWLAAIVGGYFCVWVFNENPNVAGPVIIFALCLLVMKHQSKPKTLGKKLPYRRRR